jgi:hypothetical protein
MASCCLAGLWLWFDYLSESHEISQRILTASGSFWHGIMHRREPDYPNAKYWFRQVGDHPIYEALARSAAELSRQLDTRDVTGLFAGDAPWDPFAFVDLCQCHEGSGTAAELFLRRIARTEWQLLFDYCYRQAIA